MRKRIVLIGLTVLVIGLLAIFFSLVKFPFATKEPYNVPRSSNIINESFIVPVGDTYRTANLQKGDLIHVYFIVTSGGNLDVDFLLLDELNYFKWKAHESCYVQISLSRTKGYNQDFTIPYNSTWYFVWDNSFSVITQKGVTTTISKHWNDIAYQDVTVYHTVIPTEYGTYFEYLGICLILMSVVLVGWGLVSKAIEKIA